MSGFWAFLGFAAVVAVVIEPVLVFLTFGAKTKWGKKQPGGSWIKQLQIAPAYFIDSFTKIRLK